MAYEVKTQYLEDPSKFQQAEQQNIFDEDDDADTPLVPKEEAPAAKEKEEEAAPVDDISKLPFM